MVNANTYFFSMFDKESVLQLWHNIGICLLRFLVFPIEFSSNSFIVIDLQIKIILVINLRRV